MDRGIWATWYDLPEQDKEAYLAWLHHIHIPAMLSRPGYVWAAHVQNIMTPEREQRIQRRLIHTDDPAVPTGNGYLLLYGAENPHTFVDPSPTELAASMTAEARDMMSRRIAPRSCIFVEVAWVDGPEAKRRAPGITPGPVIQFGSFNINALEHEDEMGTWYARSRLPLMAPMTGCVGARKLVSISGWAKHAILYEFVSLEAVEKYFVDTEEWSQRVVKNLIHAPHSPSLGERIWPPA
jgi:hypothetical protein